MFLGVAAGRLALARLPWSLLVSFGGVGAGRRPFLVRPDSSAHSSARMESAPSPLIGIVKSGCARLRRARGGRAGPVRAHRGNPQQGGDAFGAWPPRPRRARRGRGGPGKTAARRRRKSRRRNRGGSGFGGGFANPGIGGLPEAPDVRRPLSRGAARAATRPSSPPTGPRRRGPSIGRLRREPDPCARRRGGARTHPARGCMGPAGFGNAGSSP